MEINLQIQESITFNAFPLQRDRNHRKLEIRNWKEDTLRKQQETLHWIMKRGYWKSENPVILQRANMESLNPKSTVSSFRRAVKRWNMENGTRT